MEPAPARALNMADALARRSRSHPDRDAILAKKGRGEWTRTSFGELEARVAAISAGLAASGVTQGMRCAVFVRPSADLVAVVYALFRVGAIPIVADPGMGRERLLQALEESEPEVFIGVPKAHAARKFFPKAFQKVRLAITCGPRLFWGGKTLAQIERLGRTAQHPVEPSTSEHDTAAILFTSGSTGPPKGVVYTHGMFAAQVEALQALYHFEEGEIDLAGLPLFALFDVAFGMTSVFPPLDPSRPGDCDPKAIFETLRDLGVTTAFGSPAIWRRVVPWCIDQGYSLPHMRRVLCAGAPVPPDLIADFHRVLPIHADVFTPYGATEALPVSSLAGRDVVPSLLPQIQAGAGTCVGAPRPGMRVALIRIQDGPIDAWDESLCVAEGEIGEVCVQGDSVTEQYDHRPEATRLAKIPDPEGGLWHRMGDAARFDSEGRLWFQGRLAHRVQTTDGTRFPVPVENIFNTHERVRRTALVGVGPPGAERPVVVVEPLKGEMPGGKVMRAGFIMQLKTIGARCPLTADLEEFLFYESFPVDVRHNAKIHREELKVWAESQLPT
ncbi:MAG: AMP-binding protein [Planctomycetes bacterium]|nr:AMP-binding protein [Planctomycetota bacterium]